MAREPKDVRIQCYVTQREAARLRALHPALSLSTALRMVLIAALGK